MTRNLFFAAAVLAALLVWGLWPSETGDQTQVGAPQGIATLDSHKVTELNLQVQQVQEVEPDLRQEVEAGVPRARILKPASGKAKRKPLVRFETKVVQYGEIHGRAFDRSGAPAEGVSLALFYASPDAQSSSGESPLFGAQGGDLLANSSASVDAQGNFSFVGVPFGRYWIRAKRTHEYEYSIEVLPEPVETGVRNLMLIVDRPSLEITVRDWSGALVDLKIAYNHFGFLAEEDILITRAGSWKPSGDLGIMVLACGGPEGQVSGSPNALNGRRVGKGIYSYELYGGRDYLVGFVGPETKWDPIRVQVPLDASGETLDLVLPSDVESAELELSYLDPSGDLVEAGVRTRVFSREDQTLLWESGEFQMSKSGLHKVQHVELPAGEYFLEAERTRQNSPFRRTGKDSNPKSFFAGKVTLTGGPTQHLELRLLAPARLFISSKGRANRDDLAATHSRSQEDRSRPHAARAEQFSVTLRRAGHSPILIEFKKPNPRGSQPQYKWYFPGITLGIGRTSEEIPPGEWELEARLPGGRTIVKNVTLRSGETLEVDLQFE